MAEQGACSDFLADLENFYRGQRRFDDDEDFQEHRRAVVNFRLVMPTCWCGGKSLSMFHVPLPRTL